MSRLFTQPALDVLAMLEWPALDARLQADCWTPYGRDSWREVAFLPDQEAVAAHLRDVMLLRQCIERAGEAPVASEALSDIRPAVARALPGASLGARELGQILQTLRLSRALTGHFQKAFRKAFQEDAREKNLEETSFSRRLLSIEFPQPLLDSLSQAIDAQGDALDSASPELARLRHEERRQRERIHERLQRFLSDPNTAGALQERLITERDGRAALLVQASFKSALPGVIHGASASGATLYIEPHAVVELNNALREIQEGILEEIARIYRALTAQIAEARAALDDWLDLLGELDRRLAAARLARALQAEAPHLISDGPPMILLKRARHPLLLLQAPDPALIIANDASLGQDGERTLVITGPNTGGKTVFLKLLGLLSLMLRAGLPIPAGADSQMSLLDPILADIGDQQSLSQNLSTFSAHVGYLSRFLETAAARPNGLCGALALIDEIVAGTDPAEGAALARAILEALHQAGALTAVTTHLGELKVEARERDGYVNASVEFDAERLRPTYRLLMGAPGASNAIAIAERLGLSAAVIAQARAFLSAPQRDAAALIESLALKNRQADEALSIAIVAREDAQAAFTQADALRRQARDEKRQTLQTYKTGLQHRLRALEAELKDVQRQLRADPDAAARALKQADAAARDLFDEAREALDQESADAPLPAFSTGDRVKSLQWGLEGEILSFKPDGSAILQAGQLTITAPLSDLTPLHAATPRPRKKSPSRLARKSAPPESQSPSKSSPEAPQADTPAATLSLHVLGLRVEAALEAVIAFLDEAMLSGEGAVRIIHGHGSGALKKAIRAYLRQSPYVARYAPGAPAEGGDGQTVVILANR
ncbi:MAG: Smr/MutS family protein [Vampirovibrionales bacterium]|nr:Smr/MutS family protein [Vampirovibrionales bacterium]